VGNCMVCHVELPFFYWVGGAWAAGPPKYRRPGIPDPNPAGPNRSPTSTGKSEIGGSMIGAPYVRCGQTANKGERYESASLCTHRVRGSGFSGPSAVLRRQSRRDLRHRQYHVLRAARRIVDANYHVE